MTTRGWIHRLTGSRNLPRRLRRFVWLVSGFVVVCLAALPTLIVASQVVILLRLVGGDMQNGWGN